MENWFIIKSVLYTGTPFLQYNHYIHVNGMSKHISNTFENDYFHTFSIDMLCAMSII